MAGDRSSLHPGRPSVRMAILALSLVAFDLAFSAFLDPLRGKSYDIYQMLAPLEVDANSVVLVEIDDTALAQEGRWPWPRARIADLIRKIGAARPKALGVDILFPETSNANGDKALADAIAQTRPVLAMSLTDNASGPTPEAKAGWSVIGEAPTSLTTFHGLLSSQAEFLAVAGGLGMVRSIPDIDGVTRSVPMVWAVLEGEGVTFWPSMSLELARQALGASDYTIKLSENGYAAIRFGERIVDLTAGGAVWLTDSRDPISRLSATAVFDDSGLEMLADKIVILSVSATGFDSFHNTPLFATRPGAEIHALLTGQLLTGQFPYEPHNAKLVERAVFAGLAALLIIAMTLLTIKPLVLVPIGTVLLAAPFLMGAGAYHASAQLFDFLRPTSGIAIVAAGGSYFLFRAADARRKMISGQFAQYLSPNVVERLIKSESDAGQKAERREVTVMFMDMRGFTAASERLAPEEIVTTINRFLTIASEEIFRTDGTIDKFMGDAVMAFWNAPLDQSDHAVRALDAIRGIYRRIETENANRIKEGHEPILLGAGVESGECSVGDFGSDIRYNYTVIGHAANMASRLETATKAIKYPALGGQLFASLVPNDVETAGNFELAGFNEPVAGYKILLVKNDKRTS